MPNTIEATVLKLTNRYKVRNEIKSVKRGYKIGIGKLIEIELLESTSETLIQQIREEAKPYTIIFRES